MLRKLIEIEFVHMRMTIALKLSELGLTLSDELLPSILTHYVDSLYSQLEEHLFNERTRMNTDFVNLQIEKDRIAKECEEKVSSKDKEIEKERAEKSKYKRKLDEEQKENIRQKEWNEALVKNYQREWLGNPEGNTTHLYPTQDPTK